MTFARCVGDIFGLQLEARPAPTDRSLEKSNFLQSLTQDYNLIVLQEPGGLARQRLKALFLTGQFVQRARSSVLVLRRIRRPVTRVLLYLEGAEADGLAVEWVVRLAQSSRGMITVLAIIPPVPAMFHGLARMQPDLSKVMASDSRLGRSLSHAARQLRVEDVQSRLQLRQGDFKWELRAAVMESNPDLIAVSAPAPGRPERWLGRDPAASLLGWRDQTLLVVKPASR